MFFLNKIPFLPVLFILKFWSLKPWIHTHEATTSTTKLPPTTLCFQMQTFCLSRDHSVTKNRSIEKKEEGRWAHLSWVIVFTQFSQSLVMKYSCLFSQNIVHQSYMFFQHGLLPKLPTPLIQSVEPQMKNILELGVVPFLPTGLEM